MVVGMSLVLSFRRADGLRRELAEYNELGRDPYL